MCSSGASKPVNGYAVPPLETQLTANGTAQITQRLHRLGRASGTWNQKHSLAAFGLVLAMVLVSVGCHVTEGKKGSASTPEGRGADTQEVEQLKAKVAVLEKRMSEMEGLLPQMKPQLEQQGRQRAYRERFDRRRELDGKKYTQEQLIQAETMYVAAQRKAASPECVEILKQMLEKFPEANRTGCGFLDLAVHTTGPESEKYLRDCIQKYNDCYYGDGVQVGAFARFWLANYYSETKENKKAEALYKEIKDSYADSIDHQGQFLIERIK